MAARPSWQGHLKLSLVTCPVALYNAISPRGDVRFNLINPDTGNRIKMMTVDGGTGEQLERSQLVKGYEIAKGEYVTVTQDEIDSVKLESTKTIEIENFVPAEDIDRLYWDNPYYLVPDGKMAAEPYTVIRTAMERSGQIALGKLVMSQRERLVALEPRDDGIVATTLRTHDEVRAAKQFFDDIPNVKPDADMIAIAEKIIAQKETEFDPEEFQDRYEDALRDLIDRKMKGHKIVRPEEPKDTNVVDLMAALEASLRDSGGGRSRKSAAAERPKRAAAATAKRAPKKRAKK
ncbi:MAG: Ku protein [Pseudomonadota bacterium]